MDRVRYTRERKYSIIITIFSLDKEELVREKRMIEMEIGLRI